MQACQPTPACIGSGDNQNLKTGGATERLDTRLLAHLDS